MLKNEPSLDLVFPDWSDHPPPPWSPNDEYLEWLRDTWSWMKHTPQWSRLMKHDTPFVETPFSLS